MFRTFCFSNSLKTMSLIGAKPINVSKAGTTTQTKRIIPTIAAFTCMLYLNKAKATSNDDSNEHAENGDNVCVLSNINENRVVTIIGTVHTSRQSVQLVQTLIKSLKPDTVVIELDCKRIGYLVTTGRSAAAHISNNSGEAGVDASDGSTAALVSTQRKLIRSPTVDSKLRKVVHAVEPLGALLAQVFRSLRSVGFTSGSEFKTAVEEAFEVGANITLGDRDIDVTLRRLAAAVDSTDKDR